MDFSNNHNTCPAKLWETTSLQTRLQINVNSPPPPHCSPGSNHINRYSSISLEPSVIYLALPLPFSPSCSFSPHSQPARTSAATSSPNTPQLPGICLPPQLLHRNSPHKGH